MKPRTAGAKHKGGKQLTRFGGSRHGVGAKPIMERTQRSGTGVRTSPHTRLFFKRSRPMASAHEHACAGFGPGESPDAGPLESKRAATAAVTALFPASTHSRAKTPLPPQANLVTGSGPKRQRRSTGRLVPINDSRVFSTRLFRPSGEDCPKSRFRSCESRAGRLYGRDCRTAGRSQAGSAR